MRKKAKTKQKYNNENKDNISEPLVPGQINKNNPGTLFIFVFLTLYFLSQLSAIYLNDVRANIKIKKKRKINLLTPWPCWVMEPQRWEKGKGGGERRKRKVARRKGRRVGGGEGRMEEAAGGGTRSVRR